MIYAPSPYESELLAFERDPAPPHAHVFYGSSSIRLWGNLAQSFAGIPVVNRGFGGSTLAECLLVLPAVILPLAPASLIVYAGDNDLDRGATPTQVHIVFQQFIQRIRESFPTLPIAFISVKPSPARFWNIANIRLTNTLIRDTIAHLPAVTYIDIFTPMLTPSGAPRPELFQPDGVHMNDAAYALWTNALSPWLNSVIHKDS